MRSNSTLLYKFNIIKFNINVSLYISKYKIILEMKIQISVMNIAFDKQHQFTISANY